MRYPWGDSMDLATEKLVVDLKMALMVVEETEMGYGVSDSWKCREGKQLI